ncbi:PREDICTED: zinc finger and BTB domain-containing protein 8A isoform X2 [Nicrophorus vespilloides]|uniref:Zinc finger and BTB domain-containing protein 8A isoform X2 n=1 Tax=Nicrophorus vespilloides TaxID=110193 RepID=A0ABM1N559_NICVS|nr:PREDICTED: zinc finger and BTB domain-containing protein 8A isoform X2 [Nicrophorus vespilloides]
MYSLYRAWLSMGPCANVPPMLPSMPGTSTSIMPLNLTTPPQLASAPDVNLQVGPSMINFSAHKAVLSAHSGFFKAALTSLTGMGPIAVPNINVDEFSSLLTFMYTGYLDLNLSNIYNILLATHILHMPRALEICRSFLMQSHPLEGTRLGGVTNVIKPIASRKPISAHQEICPPIFSSLEKSEETPFKKVEAPVAKEEVAHASTSKEPEAEKQKVRKHRRDSGIAEKVTIDIACCDGPVRFHRVVNRNYGLAPPETDVGNREAVNRSDALNKIMNENIRDKLTDENSGGGEVFTCMYCNHTFKSQYCYQKHARRHLNPVDTKPPAETKREVKLLDMNVQYYPCKTCGSKFPSYYFVHKHRKLCHAEEMSDTTNKNNEIVQVNNTNVPACSDDITKDSNSDAQTSSIIDVEETE